MKKLILAALMLVLVGILLTSCGGPAIDTQRTPVPTFIPATPPSPAAAGRFAAVSLEETCAIRAVDLLGAWVTAGASETEPFAFTGLDGADCQGTYAADIVPVMQESNLWFDGAVACTACHGPDLAASFANLDLSSHAGILAGSRRQSADAQGNDILGGAHTGAGAWEQARLYQVLITRFMPLGRPPTSHEKGPVLQVGSRE